MWLSPNKLVHPIIYLCIVGFIMNCPLTCRSCLPNGKWHNALTIHTLYFTLNPPQVKKACSATYMFKNSGTCINIKVALSSFTQQQV